MGHLRGERRSCRGSCGLAVSSRSASSRPSHGLETRPAIPRARACWKYNGAGRRRGLRPARPRSPGLPRSSALPPSTPSPGSSRRSTEARPPNPANRSGRRSRVSADRGPMGEGIAGRQSGSARRSVPLRPDGQRRPGREWRRHWTPRTGSSRSVKPATSLPPPGLQCPRSGDD